MAEIVIVGGGIAGLSGAMLLARDGHRVTVLERDPSPPPAPEEAWTEWERRGVNQFRLPHLFLARFRQTLDAELPDVATALADAGALRFNQLEALPAEFTGGWRPGDERFEQLTGRRPMMEAALAGVAAREPGVTVRRGTTLRDLLTAPRGPGDAVHVTGAVTDDGDQLPADLVVDASGRRSRLPDWLAAIGAPAPTEKVADSGYIYYGRHYRSPGGEMPPMFGAPLQPYDSVTLLTLVADHGHWSVVLVASAKDAAMRRAREAEVWERVVRSYPLIAHWVDAEPVTGIDVIAKIEDRTRQLTIGAEPVATGIVALGDAAACTNPSIGRGATIALLHATCLRDALRAAGAGDTRELVAAWEARSAAIVDPLVEDTLAFDGHRRTEIECQLDGRAYETEDPEWHFATALLASAASDPDLLRAAMDFGGVLARGRDIATREGIMDKVLAAGPPAPLPGPSRAELCSILGAETKKEPACAST